MEIASSKHPDGLVPLPSGNHSRMAGTTLISVAASQPWPIALISFLRTGMEMGFLLFCLLKHLVLVHHLLDVASKVAGRPSGPCGWWLLQFHG
jgi:hypothetical protein